MLMTSHTKTSRLLACARAGDTSAAYTLIRELLRGGRRQAALELWTQVDPVGVTLWRRTAAWIRHSIQCVREALGEPSTGLRSKGPPYFTPSPDHQHHPAWRPLDRLQDGVSDDGADSYALALLNRPRAEQVLVDMAALKGELDALLGLPPEEMARRCPVWERVGYEA